MKRLGLTERFEYVCPVFGTTETTTLHELREGRKELLARLCAAEERNAELERRLVAEAKGGNRC